MHVWILEIDTISSDSASYFASSNLQFMVNDVCLYVWFWGIREELSAEPA